MNITTNAVGAEDMYYLCSANNTAEDQLAELARLVGSGGAASKEKAEPITLVESAPRLEFNLEEELSKAFASVPYSTPERAQPATETAPSDPVPVLEEAAAPVAPQPVPQSAPVAEVQPAAQPIEIHSIELIAPEAAEEVSQSDLDLGDLISKEFEQALQEEIDEPVSGADAKFVDAIEKATDTFDAELARLMGSEKDTSVAAQLPPPVPELTVTPPDEPIIVEAPVMPSVSEPEVVVTGGGESLPAQMSDFDPSQPPPSAQEELIHAVPETGEEPTSAVPEIPQTSHIEPEVAAASNVDADPAEDSIAAAPIVQSEINIDDLKEPAPQFHDDQISIPEPHAAVVIGQNRRTGRRAAGSLIAIALLAGIGLAGWNAVGGGSKSVPTIMASTDPVKVKPAEAGGTVVPNQDQAVYRSVESSKKVEPKQKSLTDNSEKPIVVAKKVDTSPEKSETRIKRNEQSENSAVVVTPRKVRTVVVKPDGTILTRSSGVKKDTQKLALNTASVKPKPVAPKLNADILAPSKVKLKKVEVKNVAPVKRPEQAKKSKSADKVAVEKKSVPTEKVAAVTKPAPVKKVAVAKTPTPAKKPESVKKVAVAKKPAPAKKIASVKKPVPAKKPKPVQKKPESVKTTASVKSPYAVQVASQRSPEAAERTFKVLARRYASVFRGKNMDIRKADIKGKGVYYRARIPAQTKASAQKICQQLKAKGGDCFVTR